MADCEKCWDTLCSCGHQYRDWTPERLREQIAMLENVLRGKYLAATAKVLSGTNDVPKERATLADFSATIQTGEDKT